jgi:hypothetical protein
MICNIQIEHYGFLCGLSLYISLSERILLPWYVNFLSFYLTVLFTNFVFLFHTSCYLLRLMANTNQLERGCLMVGLKNADVETNNSDLEWAPVASCKFLLQNFAPICIFPS